MQENVPWTGSSDGTNLLPQNDAKNPCRIQNASFNDSHVIMISTCNICQYLQQHPTLLRSSRKVTDMWRDLRWIQLLEVEIRRRSIEDCKNDHQNNEHFKGKVKGWRIKEDHGQSLQSVTLNLQAWKIRWTRPDRPGTNRKITNLHLNDAANAKTIPQSISHVCDKKSLTV